MSDEVLKLLEDELPNTSWPKIAFQFSPQTKLGLRTEKEGNTVISKLNEEMLQKISSSGNGTYVRASNSNAGLDFILNEIQNLEKAELSSTMYTA